MLDSMQSLCGYGARRKFSESPMLKPKIIHESSLFAASRAEIQWGKIFVMCVYGSAYASVNVFVSLYVYVCDCVQG